MITKKDEEKIIGMFMEELEKALERLGGKLDTFNANLAEKEDINKLKASIDKYYKENLDELRLIHKKLDEFLDIMKHFSREQKILIKKMREIEKYFDPPGRN
jgi:hypothetical protein